MFVAVAFFCALLTAFAFDVVLVVRGELPPGFQRPERRALALALLVFLFWIAVFMPLFQPEEAADIDLTKLHPSELFLGHAMMLAVVAAWYSLGYARVDAEAAPHAERDWRKLFRLRPQRPIAGEIAFGLLAGFGAWFAVLSAALGIGLIVSALGYGEEMGEVSPYIVFMAGLPVGWRVLLSLSAGFVEELFFRGFLQPRLGIAFTTILFAVGHAGYRQPFMLIGVGLLSLIYGVLARRRGDLWAAITAHALFDAVQLLIVIPGALPAVLDESAATTACFW